MGKRGRGRPRLGPDKLAVFVGLKIKHSELRLLKPRAKVAGLTLQGYIRTIIIKDITPTPSDGPAGTLPRA